MKTIILKRMTTLMLVLLLFFTNVTIIANATDEEQTSKTNYNIEETVDTVNTEDTVETEPNNVDETISATENTTYETVPPETKIVLATNSKVLYVKEEYLIDTTVEYGSGETTFTSNNNNIATVTNDGTVKAVKKGTTEIIVRNNNTTAKFTVTVKNPTINIKKNYKLAVGTSKKIKVTGEVGTAKFNSSNPGIIKVTNEGKITAKKPGKAIITVKANGFTFKRKVTSEKKLKIIYKLKKKKLTINVGQTKKVTNLLDYSTNLYTLKKYISYSKLEKYADKVLKEIKKYLKNPSVEIADTNIAKYVESSKKIKPLTKGKTKITFACGSSNLTIPLTITKKSETTIKGETAKVVYSFKQLYEVFKDMGINYILKGDEPKYKYVLCSFTLNNAYSEIRGKMLDLAKEDFESKDNFYSVMDNIVSFNDYSVSDNGNAPYYIEILPTAKGGLKEQKKLYNEAQKILDSINIDSFEEDYEKLIALYYWFKTTCTYGTCPYFAEELDSERGIIYDHKGVCSDYAVATNYFCALLKIPSVRNLDTTKSNHEWNYVKLGDKWYHLDNLNGMKFYGNYDIYEKGLQDNSYMIREYNYDLDDMESNYAFWKTKISDESIVLKQSKLKEIAEKCGITTDKNGYKIWRVIGKNIIDDLTE